MRWALLAVATLSCRLDVAGLGEDDAVALVQETAVVVDSAVDSAVDSGIVDEDTAVVVDTAVAETMAEVAVETPGKCDGLPSPLFLATKNKCFWVAGSGGGGIATTKCIGGHIATIAADEQATVVALVKREARAHWIGLRSFGGTDPNDFVWSPPDPSPYRNWGPGEPKKMNGGCVIMLLDGKWVNRPCESVFPVVCERD